MSKSWNGASLVNEFSKELGDTSTTFKAQVLAWINDVLVDIYSRNAWPFAMRKGKKTLTASVEMQNLNLSQPIAPTLASGVAGGSLTASTAYRVLITFYEGVSGAESIAGLSSNSVSTDTSIKQFNITAIPLSLDSLVTARKVYLSLGTGDFYYHSTISNNTATTLALSTDTSSTLLAPDCDAIAEFYGNPFIETASQLIYKSTDELRRLFGGSWGPGTPHYWSNFGNHNSLLLYPIPSSAIHLSF